MSIDVILYSYILHIIIIIYYILHGFRNNAKFLIRSIHEQLNYDTKQ